MSRHSPDRPRNSRRGLLTLLAAFVAALGAAVAFDQWRVAEKRREFVPRQADPSMLPPPDVTNWRGTLLPLGGPAPGFSLVDVRTGERVSLQQFRGRPVVLMLSSFGCNVFCGELEGLTALHERYKAEVTFLFVSIRDAGHPDPKTSPPVGEPRPGESPSETRLRLVREGAEFLRLPFPTLLDADGKVERAYEAFPKRLVVIDREGRIAYDGGRGAQGGPSDWNLAEVEKYLRPSSPRAPE